MGAFGKLVFGWGVFSLVGCGQTTEDDGWQPLTGFAGTTSATGGSAGTTTAGSSGSGGAAATAGASGAAGSPATLGPPADIRGRWGMFDFEDPVGVQLVEDAAGTLTGHGCAAGAPGYQDGETSLCGNLYGEVVGHTASFGFGFDKGQGGYSFQLTISNDGQRMTGTFNNGVSDLPTPIAWLRVPPNESWLARAPYNEKEALAGRYELRLLPGESNGDEYTANKAYHLGYWRRAIRGDLGSFWGTELSDPELEASPLRIGPVAPTAAELPYVMSLDFDLTGITHVTAHTTSGGKYAFTVLKLP